MTFDSIAKKTLRTSLDDRADTAELDFENEGCIESFNALDKQIFATGILRVRGLYLTKSSDSSSPPRE